MRKHLHIYMHGAVPQKTRDGKTRDCGCNKAADGQQAYRGYLITNNPMRPNEFYVSKNGTHIGTCKTLEEAKKIIDSLV